jgi:sugar phosphate isomerase/epimerase
MKIEQVALILYTVREHCKTTEDFARTLKRVHEIGYRAVQVSGVDGSVSLEDVKRICDDEGLTICATHESDKMILNNPKEVAKRLDILGCSATAYPYPGGVKMDTLEDIRAFAKQLDASGAALRAAGKMLMYHNHNVEFRKYEGRTMLEIIYAETSPENLQAELDTYWVQNGGANPADWCRRMKGRLPMLHMKDYMTNSHNSPAFAEIGEGNIDWKQVVKAADEAGVEWFIVEQDSAERDVFESIRMSYDYVTTYLCD